MSEQKLKDNLRFEESNVGVVFNHYSFCELIKHIMVKYGSLSYKTANEKLNNYFLAEVPRSLDDVYFITHELEFHWAMLIIHGPKYWMKGVPADFNNFEDEYLTWEAEIKRKYNLKEPYIYYDIETGKNNCS